ncbi:DNA-3-methyladenine glycosylase [Nocardioides pacificus]
MVLTSPAHFGWLRLRSEAAARRLLGCELERRLDTGELLRARIVETEAYDEDDEASHTYRGRTERNAAMFGPAGRLYVYRMRGHHCCNVVTGEAGYGQGALLRAVEPLAGEATMSLLRGGRAGADLASGPGKLCQALAITHGLYGHDLASAPLRLIERPPLDPAAIVASPRIGVSRAVTAHRRFHLRDNVHVSRR